MVRRRGKRHGKHSGKTYRSKSGKVYKMVLVSGGHKKRAKRASRKRHSKRRSRSIFGF